MWTVASKILWGAASSMERSGESGSVTRELGPINPNVSSRSAFEQRDVKSVEPLDVKPKAAVSPDANSLHYTAPTPTPRQMRGQDTLL